MNRDMSFLDDVRYVLFDMDGVLLDTEQLYTVAYNHVLQEYGVQLDWETKSAVMGRPALESAAYVIHKFGLPLKPEEVILGRKTVLEELFRNAQPMPGAVEFVTRLHERGVRMAVATSTIRSVFEVKTEKHPWFSLFDVIVCGDDPELERPKPAPDIFLLAARRLGVSPEQCVIFEDSPAGVQAAVASGGRVVALVDPHVDRKYYTKATRIIGAYEELSE